ncbi:MAG: hypothetical protein OXD48_13320 [Litoreibacter sp.]|nr:hypothetical protein [Litoreibacter sp.]
MTRWGIIKRLALVTFVLFLATNWVAFFDIQGGSFSQRLLDFRVFGYTAQEAEMFSRSLSFEEKGAYREVYLILDYVFIGFFGALLYALSQTIPTRRTPVILLGVIVAFVVLDICENLMVSQFVGGQFALAGVAGWVTLSKFVAVALVAVILLLTWRKKGFS